MKNCHSIFRFKSTFKKRLNLKVSDIFLSWGGEGITFSLLITMRDVDREIHQHIFSRVLKGLRIRNLRMLLSPTVRRSHVITSAGASSQITRWLCAHTILRECVRLHPLSLFPSRYMTPPRPTGPAKANRQFAT